MKTRFFINKLHFYLALISALPIAVLCVTGSILVYKEAIDEYFTRPYMHSEVPAGSGGEKMAIAEMVKRLEDELPGKEFLGVVLPAKESQSYFFWIKDAPFWTVAYINPYTGEFKGLRAWEDWTMANIIWWVTDLHYSFKWGRTGSYIVAASSFLLFCSIISGLILWWPRNSRFTLSKFALKKAKRWKQTAFNFHAVLGMYVSLILILVTLTGITITFYQPFSDFIHTLTSETAPAHPTAKAEEGNAFLSVEEILQRGQAHLRESYALDHRPQSMAFPTKDNVIVEIGFQGRDEYVGVEHSHVFVHAQSGEIVSVETAANRSKAETFVAWMGPIHYGTWGIVFGGRGDLYTRIVWFIAALLPLFLMLSGFSFVKKSRWKNVFRPNVWRETKRDAPQNLK